MSLDSDILIDRLRLRRKLTFWRVFAFLVVLIAIGSIFAVTGGKFSSKKHIQHIARIAITGTITENRQMLELIKEVGDSKEVEGVIISINSPGGTTTGGEALYHALRELSQKKPVVATIGTVGASAAYMTAVATDHIIARYNSMTGSIGVLFQYGNAGTLLDTIGLKLNAVKSSPLKAEPNFYEPATPEAIAVLESLVNDSYQWFMNVVAERRGFTTAQIQQLANGQVYSGHQAKEKNLIDAIGGEDEAKAWLVSKKGLNKNLKIVHWKPAEESATSLLKIKASSLFLGQDANILENLAIFAKKLTESGSELDGLLSVWQAPHTSGDTKWGDARND
ncbi:signal peptide peptidase SppA [Flexibacterium corallicola]|uniref:signal peptide peptidase SppA n=1 Tax=Flexibacterium corallicola TaxID=3037259 RepID=UPI00286EBB30|nr:signal peptide peptidase SppA [Pseudovibrio sp. M1P-2-3]